MVYWRGEDWINEFPPYLKILLSEFVWLDKSLQKTETVWVCKVCQVWALLWLLVETAPLKYNRLPQMPPLKNNNVFFSGLQVVFLVLTHSRSLFIGTWIVDLVSTFLSCQNPKLTQSGQRQYLWQQIKWVNRDMCTSQCSLFDWSVKISSLGPFVV